MKTDCKFVITEASDLQELKAAWQKTLVAPQDGMWEALTNMGQHWSIVNPEGTALGYISLDSEGRLLQFYVDERCLAEGREIFAAFIEQEQIKECLVGTNNPIFLSLALHFQKSVDIHTYLFTDCEDTFNEAGEGFLRKAEKTDLNLLVDFCHISMGGPKTWLSGYLGNLIERQELFMLEQEGEILGTCEIRKSDTHETVADVGMIVSKDHRKKGLGTKLLGMAKSIAREWGRTPVCSCEKDNIGSRKAIEHNGFRSLHQMLTIKF